MKMCPKCGAKNADAATYCESCGNDLTGKAEAQGPWKCAQCGRENSAPAKFCAGCGARKGEAGAESQPAKTMFFGAIQGQGQARLTLIRGGDFEGASYQLASKEHLAGRTEGFILFPDDAYCSPTHCNFYYDGGKLFVEDKGSLNGVYLRIKQPVEVTPKMLFRIGEQLFHFDLLGHFPPIANLKVPEDGTVLFGSPVEKGPKVQLAQILEGGQVGAVYYIQKESYLVGREGCDLNFPTDRFISGKHARLNFQNGKWYLVDAGSKNGTFIKVQGKQELGNGDYVFIGQQLLRVEML